MGKTLQISFNNLNRWNKMLLQIILQISKSCPYVVIKVQHLPKFLNAVALFSVHNGVKSLMKFIWFSRTLQSSNEPVRLGYLTAYTIPMTGNFLSSIDCVCIVFHRWFIRTCNFYRSVNLESKFKSFRLNQKTNENDFCIFALDSKNS